VRDHDEFVEKLRYIHRNPRLAQSWRSLFQLWGLVGGQSLARRAAKVGIKFYWYGSGGEILAETDASGNTQNEYVYFGGRRVAMIPAGSTPLYYGQDMLGSSRVMVQSNGTLCYDADFTPFGAELPYTSTCSSNYKFEGKERDTETGNDDFGARNYSWRYGRWLSSDWSSVPVPVPYANLTNPQTLNLYSMVSDDPESFADLDGHNGICISGNCGNQTVTGCDYDHGFCSSQPPSTPPDEQGQQQAAVVQQTSDSSGGHGFWSHVSNLLHGHSWNYGMRESVTTTILPNFYSASAEAGPLSQSVSYVPSTNNLYYGPGVGTGSGISLTAGWATDPNGFSGGPSGSLCLFAGVGGCGGISTSGDYAGQVGVGIGGWGAAAGYGVDPIQTIGMGMVNGEPVDPLATKVGDVYMEDPQMWIPQN